MAKRNNFRRALKQLKSVEIEEKLNGLNEAPTNSMGGVYNLNAKGWHNDPPKPAKTFYPDKDGNWPDGFPANAGDKSYTRPAGWWDNDGDWTDVELANTKVDSIGTDGKSTEGIIEEDGYVKTPLPPGTRDFILGPLIDGFTYLHGYDAYTSIGYIQKDTRAFVLLGYIDGQWAEGFHHTSSSVDVWDGTESGFTSYNDKFKLEHALWFRDQVLRSKYTYNVPYFKNGGTPQQRPWPPAGGWPSWIPEPLRDLLDNMFGGACPGVGNGDSADEEDLAQPSGSGGHGPDEGEPWTPPGPYEKGDQEDAGGPWPDNPDAPSNRPDGRPDTPDTPRSKKRKKDEQTARDHGISQRRASEMSDSELRNFNNEMERYDKDIKKYGDEKKALDKEARDILIQFGIDAALTIFGGAILKGAAVGIGAAVKGARAANKARQVAKVASTLQKGSKLSKAAATTKAANIVNRADKIKKSADASRKAAQAAQKAQKATQAAANKPGGIKSPYPKGYKGPQTKGPLTGRNVDGSRIKQVPKGQPGSSTSPYPKGYKGPQKTGPLTGKPIPKATPKTTPTPKSPQSTSIKNGPLSRSQTPKKGPGNKFKESDLNIKGPDGNVIGKNVKNPKTGRWERINKPGKDASSSDILKWERLEGQVSNKAWQNYLKTGKLDPGPIGNPLAAIKNFRQGPTIGARKYGIPGAAGALGGGLAIGNEIRKGVEKLINDQGASKAVQSISNDKATTNVDKISQLDAVVKNLEKGGNKIDKGNAIKAKENAVKTAIDDLPKSKEPESDLQTILNRGLDIASNTADKVIQQVIKSAGEITGLESSANMANSYQNFLANPTNERIDKTSDFSRNDLNALQNVRNNSEIKTAIELALKGGDKKVKGFDNKTVGDLRWEIAADKVTSELQKIVHNNRGLDNSIHNNVQIDREAFKNSNGKEIIIVKNYEFRPGGSVAAAEKMWQGKLMTKLGFDLDTAGTGPAAILGYVTGKVGLTNANKYGGLYKSPTMRYKVVVPTNSIKRKTINNRDVMNFKTLGMDYKLEGQVLSESTRRQLREIKKPYEIREEPVQKLKKYRPNFKGKFKAQNTPDVTASKQSDELVASGNAKGQTWRTKDKNWSRYETQERMNVVFDKVGHGNMAWDMIVNENQRKNSWKNRQIQEQLNMIAAEKGERQLYPDYESPWGKVIHEQQTIDTDKDPAVKVKHPLVKGLAKRLKGQIDYPEKPAKKGYPNDPPPKMVDGWHPKLGKKYKYDKLDPVSARAMPMQGDPEIDANIKKARQEPKIEPGKEPKKVPIPAPKVKKEQYSDWRSEEKIRKGLTNA